MFDRLFPHIVDNRYQGHWLALWILWPLVLVKALMGFNCAGLNPWVDNRQIMEGVDGIPLSTFPVEAANAALFGFSAWGLGLFVLSLFAIAVLLRWRALVPFAYLLLCLEQFGRKAISLAHPFERVAADAGGVTPGLMINWTLSGLLLIGFALSLAGQRRD